jgi:hypothetical protein
MFDEIEMDLLILAYIYIVHVCILCTCANLTMNHKSNHKSYSVNLLHLSLHLHIIQVIHLHLTFDILFSSRSPTSNRHSLISILLILTQSSSRVRNDSKEEELSNLWCKSLILSKFNYLFNAVQ